MRGELLLQEIDYGIFGGGATLFPGQAVRGIRAGFRLNLPSERWYVALYIYQASVAMCTVFENL